MASSTPPSNQWFFISKIWTLLALFIIIGIIIDINWYKCVPFINDFKCSFFIFYRAQVLNISSFKNCFMQLFHLSSINRAYVVQRRKKEKKSEHLQGYKWKLALFGFCPLPWICTQIKFHEISWMFAQCKLQEKENTPSASEDVYICCEPDYFR